jgi:spermidine synthase
MSSTTTVPTAPPVAPLTRDRRVDLFLVSFLLLFLELASIRFFGSSVVFLTFFTNLVLLGCFLGMSVGCLAAWSKRDYLAWTLPLSLTAVVLARLTTFLHRVFGKVLIDVGGQGSPQQVFFGTEYRAIDPGTFVVPIESIAGVFFLIVALSFVGLGQEMGRAFNSVPNRVVAYTANVLGSLSGIAAFGVMSELRMPPVLWYAAAALLVFRFLRRWSAMQVSCAIGLVTALALISYRDGMKLITIWSPYYKIAYSPQHGTLVTNNIGHQVMTNLAESGGAYMLPYLLNRDAGRPPFAEAMIIGAGSGNDVAAALAGEVGHVDAVEIEPVLNEIGREDHPNRPYDSRRVSIHIDDGRSFVRKTGKVYDLIAYALVDSLVLHSGYSTLRLESFLFTEEAFRDIAAKLKPDGVFVMYNFYRRGWIVGRLQKTVEQVFGTEPLVIPLPHTDSITAAGTTGGGVTFLIAGKPGSKTFDAIRAKFREKSSYWLSERPRDNENLNAFGSKLPTGAEVQADRWQLIAPCRVDTSGIAQIATDDWPFLYLREPMVPALNLRGMAIIGALSILLLVSFAPVRTRRPSGRMFFLGAGFMLLETKSVVHMALLFGSTWYVNSVVFFAILVMILLSNLYVLGMKPRRVWPYYVLLIVALFFNAFVPMSSFLNLPGAWKVVVSCAVVFVPIFFAGVIFAAAFRDSQNPDIDFGSNIGGVILGGLCENLSLVVGFGYLILVAMAFYVFSWLLRPRGGVPAA